MVEYDTTWREPTEPQLAAWRHACKAMRIPKKDMVWFDTPGRHHWQVVHQATGRVFAVDADVFSGGPHELTPHDLAELMLLSQKSLWYTQAAGWKDGDTPFMGRMSYSKKARMLARATGADKGEPEEEPFDIGERFQNIFKLAGDIVVKVVDWGYQDGVWWDLTSIYADAAVAALGMTAVLEAVRIIDSVNTPKDGFDTLWRVLSDDTSYMLSQGMRWFPKLLLPRLNTKTLTKMLGGDTDSAVVATCEVRAEIDPEYRKEWLAIKRKVKAKIGEEYEPAPCVHPNCDNLVAPKGIKPRDGHFKNYRATGACQRGHNSYFCTKCKGPHSHSSKTGKGHFEKHYGCDFTAEAKAAWDKGDDPCAPGNKEVRVEY